MLVRFTNPASSSGFASSNEPVIVGDFSYNTTSRVVTVRTGVTVTLTPAGNTSLLAQLNQIARGDYVVVEG